MNAHAKPVSILLFLPFVTFPLKPKILSQPAMLSDSCFSAV